MAGNEGWRQECDSATWILAGDELEAKKIMDAMIGTIGYHWIA